MFKLLLILLLLPYSISAKDILLERSRLLYFSTNLKALKHTQFEIGFTHQKKTFGYSYHTFVTPYMFLSTVFEDEVASEKQHTRTNLGALGVKFGGIFPINEDEPLYFQLGIGLAKLNAQENPFLGQLENSILKETRWAIHLGFIFAIDDILTRVEYTASTKSYVDNQLLFSIGLNF